MSFRWAAGSWRRVALFMMFSALWGCTDSDMSDLDAFMAEKRARPGGVIEPIPVSYTHLTLPTN